MASSLRFLPKNGGGDGYNCTGGGAALEVTVLSAESLRLPPSYSPLPRRLRPYVTVSSDTSSASDSDCYSTTVASSSSGAGGGGEHSWAGSGGGGTVVVPVGRDFLAGRADVHVSVMSEPACRIVGATPLGWCAVPAADVLDGLRAPCARRRLSYSLRCPRRGGAQQHAAAVVHLAVRVLGLGGEEDHQVVAGPAAATAAQHQQQGWCRVAMGIPVTGASAAAAVVGTPAWPWGATSSR
ncbi:hypothetical protein PR202_ga18298 [Eleusine coracana subsp. coracana]|uniref:Uncharacterized protein n=1 Tax=Eleusine coracana subsp. coracana TaxID=191504 RepID=A0AAV5CRF6_ELECO|nr:hypothetical protein QOZ80_6AG0507090 [Eleusine coracana subsp. coracana]GJN01063.1 hypothetical protein PR202_ga18298 [Eleusine coracana subsp. coracana]